MTGQVKARSRKEAKALGEKTYFTGKPCKHGHVDFRSTSDGGCRACDLAGSRAWKAKNHAHVLEYAKSWRESNPERHRANSKAWAEANPERKRELGRAWRETNWEHHRARKKEWELANREYLLNKKKEWREANPERVREHNETWHKLNPERNRELSREWYAANREFCRERERERRKANPEHIKFLENKRRARERDAGSFGKEDLERIWSGQKGKCAECECCLTKNGHHLDHIYPLSRGGTNYPSNLQFLCPSCNMRKSAKLPIDWARENGRLL